MKILFLTPQLPYPPRQGTTIRNDGLIRHLAQRHTIDLLTFVTPEQEPDHNSPLYHACRRIAYLPQPIRSLRQRAIDTLRSPLPDMALRLESPAMHNLVQSWLVDGYDIVQVEGIEMAQYGFHALDKRWTGANRPLLIFDDHNCEYLLQKRNALTDLQQPKRWPAALYSLIQWQKLRHYERQICQRADAVLAVSPVDQQALEQLTPGLHVTVIANGIDATIAQSPVASRQSPPTLLFTGKMDYRPNVDAVLWFADEVLPLIQREAPTVHFQIVGMNPHPRLERLRSNPAIEITGGVESVVPYFQAATIYVTPLRVGGGTRFKVLDAMLHGKAIVSTTLGVEGLGVRHEEELLLADTPTAFAAAILRLVNDIQTGGALGRQLGTNAQYFVKANYSWQQIIPKVEEVYRQVQAQ
ncbi:MAG: glycosyltransferase [Caldilinea sp. CFX5]|nr:glycosyltransferase [Caldilinea sp. CFX5]